MGRGVFHLQRGRDLHAASNRARDRAVIGVETQNTFGRLALGRIDLQTVLNVDAFNHQDLVIQFYLAGCFGDEPAAAGRYLARFQRASKGPGQSAGGRGDHKIQRRVMWLDHVGVDSVMGRDF